LAYFRQDSEWIRISGSGMIVVDIIYNLKIYNPSVAGQVLQFTIDYIVPSVRIDCCIKRK